MHTDTLLWLDSDEELDNRSGREQFVELDSLDTEKALLLTDNDDPLWVCSQLRILLLNTESDLINLSDYWIPDF